MLQISRSMLTVEHLQRYNFKKSNGEEILMPNTCIYVKGILKEGEKYLVLKHWMDDRIQNPFLWEFIDGDVFFGEAPDDAILRLIRERLGVEGQIDKLLYTWSMLIGDTHCVGITYLCHTDAEESQFVLTEEYGSCEWIVRDKFEYYIENNYVLKDLEGVEL
jgi:nucleoside triphosphatase